MTTVSNSLPRLAGSKAGIGGAELDDASTDDAEAFAPEEAGGASEPICAWRSSISSSISMDAMFSLAIARASGSTSTERTDLRRSGWSMSGKKSKEERNILGP